MKPSPVGLLLIGAGIVVLALGWTGRFADVWAALRGTSLSDFPDSPVDAGSKAGAEINKKVGDVIKNLPPEQPRGLRCKDGELHVHITSGANAGGETCAPGGNVGTKGSGACPTGYTEGYIENTSTGQQTQVCFRRQSNPNPNIPQAGYGGSYARVPLPTGFMGLRYQPNV